MLKIKRTRSTQTALLAMLFTGGLVLTLSARAAAPDSQPTQATPQSASTPKQGASGSQPKTSPYAKMNRQHAQAREAGATNPPPPAASPAARKGKKSGVAKKS